MSAVPSRPARGPWPSISLCCSIALAGVPVRARAQNDVAQSTVYVRADGDTTIVTPALHVGAQVSDATRVDLTYLVDVWTSASVDIVTAATPRVSEQRDEVDVSLAHTLRDVALGASYRHSIENDYESNGGTLGASFDFAQKNSTLALVARALFDQVWAAGDEAFKRPASTLGARLTFTQVLDPNMLGQVTYEVGRQSGYLSSPYRFVRVADDLGNVPTLCAIPLDSCLPEHNPHERFRHAVALALRRALSDTFSLGAVYRFYVDDWQLESHTAQADLAFAPNHDWLLDLSYRFYTQGNARHYRPFYPRDSLPAYYTSDKELSALTSQQLHFELTKLWALSDDAVLRTVLLVSPTLYTYPNFPLQKRALAFAFTLSAGVEL